MKNIWKFDLSPTVKAKVEIIGQHTTKELDKLVELVRTTVESIKKVEEIHGRDS